MLFLKSTSINEIFNKKKRLNSGLRHFEALSERRRRKDKEELSQNRNSVREKEKNYKAIYSTDNAAKGKRIRWGFLLGSRDAHSKNRWSFLPPRKRPHFRSVPHRKKKAEGTPWRNGLF
jgi:hypothetical protein